MEIRSNSLTFRREAIMLRVHEVVRRNPKTRRRSAHSAAFRSKAAILFSLWCAQLADNGSFYRDKRLQRNVGPTDRSESYAHSYQQRYDASIFRAGLPNLWQYSFLKLAASRSWRFSRAIGRRLRECTLNQNSKGWRSVLTVLLGRWQGLEYVAGCSEGG